MDWIRRFILFHDKRHPETLGAAEVEAFLTHLSVERQVAAATQNLAKSSILFLYREVLERDLPWLENVELGRLRGVHQLLGRLLCGTGMRIWKACGCA